MFRILDRGSLPLLLLVVLPFAPAARAGVTNPNISVIGIMRLFTTNDSTDINHDRAQFSLDETEIQADAALNPFANGTFVFAIADGGIEVEEGYFYITHGLPRGLGFKAGKYRVGFGKLNPMHDHAYPFIERFRVLAAYLPGDESYNEIGGQVSYRIPFPGDVSSILSMDVLQGNSLHPDEPDSRPAWLGRWSNFFLVKDPSALELGVDVSQGTNNVAAKTMTTLYGADAKLKWWFNARDFLMLQAEVLGMDREDPTVDDQGNVTVNHMKPFGGYIFGDYTFRKLYNAGLKYERFQRPEQDANGDKPWDASVGAWTGLSLLEETTLFRLNWDRFLPKDAQAYNTFTLQALWSMGPHKAHQF
jgi:hypothetical protein